MKNKFLKNSFKILILILILATGLHFGHTVDAQGLETGGTGLQIAGTEEVAISSDIPQDRTLGDVIKGMVNYFIGFLGFIAVLTFVYAGVLWVVSGGEDAMITKAKKIMTYSALGLVVVILSFSIVRFITSSAGGGTGAGISCASDADCGGDTICNIDTKLCVSPESGATTCTANTDCAVGFACIRNTCSRIYTGQCLTTSQCRKGQFCSVLGTCLSGNNLTCSQAAPCPDPKKCDTFGFCHNPNAGSDSICGDNSDCPTGGFVCNLDLKKCEIEGNITGPDYSCKESRDCPYGFTCNSKTKICEIEGGVLGGGAQAASEEALKAIDETVSGLEEDLGTIGEDINSLSQADKDAVMNALDAGTLADKMAGVKSLLENSGDPAVISVLEKLFSGLERLQLLRRELDDLRAVMPESTETVKSYDETSKVLDELIDDPTSNIKLRRFENMYRTLKELIRKFPIVMSRIKASPGEGNVPFTVTFDGLDSSDPTGGTISEYKWSFLDNAGNVVSLGNSPVAIYEFTEPNTYSVRLQVSTSNKDQAGYKTAMDGISTVRIKANPPSSQVAFRINGAEVLDVYHVTLAEAKAGVSFDPALTVPALGRTIEKYEWLYGDTTNEERTVPATVVHSYGKAGEYFVTLKATDSVGLSDKRVVKLVVKSLAADVEFIPEEGNVNTEFRFRGINSRSDDGIIDAYQWQITDATGAPITTSSQENFYYTFDRPGKYNVELMVTDTSGAQDKSVRVLDVFSRKPVASFDFEIPEPNHPNTVEFSAAGSYDPDQGDQITYSWDFNGDGQFETVDSKEVVTTHTYNKVGQYKVTLQVMDTFGQRNQIEKGITIDSVLAGDIVIDKKAAQVAEEITFKAESPTAVAYLWSLGMVQR